MYAHKKKSLCRTWNILFQAISCNFQRKYISICFSLAMCFPLQNHPYRIIDQKHIPSSFFFPVLLFFLVTNKNTDLLKKTSIHFTTRFSMSETIPELRTLQKDYHATIHDIIFCCIGTDLGRYNK